MRAPLFGAVCLASAVIAEAFAASNSAHVCGDKRLSAPDQMECRAQMDAAKSEGERLRIQDSFEKLSANATGEASSNAKRNTSTTTSASGPQTKPAAAPADSYPPAVDTPPVYPGEVPNPKPASHLLKLGVLKAFPRGEIG